MLQVNEDNMTQLYDIASRPYQLIVGLGATGYSVVRFLCDKGMNVLVVDNRDCPPGLKNLKQNYPDVVFSIGNFDSELFSRAERIIVSPGVSLRQPAIKEAMSNGVAVTGDIELFAEEVKAPVIGITGSNGKSTVTTLVNLMAKKAGKDVAMGGNIGTPALDLLDRQAELYVLELSSFQLETTRQLGLEVAAVLNISPDHMDRYDSINEYAASKKRIYHHAKKIVINKDDAMLMDDAPAGEHVIGFTLGQPGPGDFGVEAVNGEAWLSFENQKIIKASDLKIKGQHNIANALAALSIGHALNLPVASMVETLLEFDGLSHRTQWVADINGVQYFNDSKATNVGAAVAAIQGLPGMHVLIAGGDGKGADFSALKDVAKDHLRAVVLIGRDAGIIERALDNVVKIEHAKDMQQAVRQAAALALNGDNVLLSPACASFDMFKNFEHRGDVFMQAVREYL